MEAVERQTRDSVKLWQRGWFRTLLVWILVIAAALLGTRFYKTGTEPSSQTKAQDPAQYAQENYSAKVVPNITEKAVDLKELTAAIATDGKAACEKYGHRNGTSPCSYPVKFTAKLAQGDFGTVAAEVAGVPSTRKVAIQTGPAIVGTAVRDATGFINFDMFENQIAYAKVATELNNQVKADVLTKNKLTSMVGQTVKVVGAFTDSDPSQVLVTPISIEKSNG